MSDQTIEQRLEAELKPILGTHVKQSILYHNLLQLIYEAEIAVNEVWLSLDRMIDPREIMIEIGRLEVNLQKVTKLTPKANK